MRKCLFAAAMYIVLAASIACAADIHVDSAAAAGGNGSASTPYNTFALGLAAAGNGDTIRVHGGTGQTYSDYPYTVWQTNLTVAAAGPGRPLFSVTAAAIPDNSAVFLVSAPGFRVSGTDFYGTPTKCSTENSAIIWFLKGSENAIIENSRFNWSTENTVKMGSDVRGDDSATNVVVRNNIFTNHRSQYANGTVINLGNYAQAVGNVFTNMHTAINLGNYGVVLSNTVVNSNSAKGALLNGGYNRNRSALIAFNTVVQSNGGNNPAIYKSRECLTALVSSAPTRIYNNTVVGSANFIQCSSSDISGSAWAPVIVNNIAICTSTNIVDISPTIHANNNGGQTIFNAGTIIQNNILTSGLGVIFENRVTLLCAANVHDNLSRLVAFRDASTPTSDRYLVPTFAEKPYIDDAYGTPANGYPRFIGAKPAYIPPGTCIVIQ